MGSSSGKGSLRPPSSWCRHRKCLRWCRQRTASPNLASDGTAAPGDGAEGGGTVAHPAAEDCRSAGEWQQTTGSGICFGRSLS